MSSAVAHISASSCPFSQEPRGQSENPEKDDAVSWEGPAGTAMVNNLMTETCSPSRGAPDRFPFPWAWRQVAREDIPGSGQSPPGKILIKGTVKGASKVKLKSFILFTLKKKTITQFRRLC